MSSDRRATRVAVVGLGKTSISLKQDDMLNFDTVKVSLESEF